MFAVRTLRRVIQTRPITRFTPPPANPCIYCATRSFAAQSESSDAGAEFDDGTTTRSQRGVATSSLSESSGEFRRSSPTGILAPRAARSSGQRVDDPSAALSTAMISQINQFHIKSEKDESVPIGSPLANPNKPKPQKGGRPIHPADVIEQRGKLTPMQIHRILSTLQQNDPQWTMQRLSQVYDVDIRQLELIRTHLMLPYVHKDMETLTWQGTRDVPNHVQIQRSLGHQVDLPLMGHHIQVDKKVP